MADSHFKYTSKVHTGTLKVYILRKVLEATAINEYVFLSNIH